MPHDQLEVEGQTTRRGGGGRFIVTGIVGACALGVGLGLWARPSSAERGDAPPPPKPEVEAKLSDRRLQIVLDDTPAPIGQLLEVMPADTPGLMAALPTEALPPLGEPMPPRGPPLGLMKVDAPVEAAPVVIPAVRAEAGPEPKAEKPREQKTKLEKPRVEKASAKTAAAKAETKKTPTKVAKVEPKAKKKIPAKALAKAEKPDKKTGAAAERKKPVKLAKSAPAPKKAKGQAETPPKLTKLVKTVKAAPKKLKASTTATAERKKKRDLELARAQEAKRAKAQAQRVAEAKAKAKAKAKPPVEKAAAPKKKPVPRGEGPMRVARNNGCASTDPGEALVCADPRLNQRDRQLQRAFRDAEAAGVPASALRRQEERWRQARAAAARDGSWAVEDVYEARIAELNDLARDAREF